MVAFYEGGVSNEWFVFNCKAKIYPHVAIAVQSIINSDTPRSLLSCPTGVVDVVYIVDLVLNFRTGVVRYHDGKLNSATPVVVQFEPNPNHCSGG